MLFSIKNAIAEEKMDNITLEAKISMDDDYIRDKFLAEEDEEDINENEEEFLDTIKDDPELAALIEKIPEYDGDITDEELEELQENFIPEE